MTAHNRIMMRIPNEPMIQAYPRRTEAPPECSRPPELAQNASSEVAVLSSAQAEAGSGSVQETAVEVLSDVTHGAWTWRSLVAIALLGLLCLSSLGCGKAKPPKQRRPKRPTIQPAETEDINFNKDVAAIIWKNCSSCHRPGEAAPFSLLSYEDVRKRADQIFEVTQSRYMPPWLAETTDYALEGDLRLKDDELALIRRWSEAGAPEGNPSDLPEAPTWTPGWQLGTPDLVVTMPRSYTLPAEGTDVYRNFIIPTSVKTPRYVRSMEFRPGNYRIVHHAFIMTDPTLRLRRFEDEDAEPGFEGMDTRGAQPPDGHFIGWQPGRAPYVAPDGMSWRLYPSTDLVIQVHMQPTGKPETLQASIGLYFTDEPPRKRPTKIGLRSIDIDIPAGVEDYPIQDEFELPVDLTVLAVAPHAHYLGKQMFGKAILPDGSTKTIFAIREWDPNWQREYRFREPIELPAGTRLVQEFTYDNSANNIRNPNNPPQRVRYGLNATDEMGSLWFQVLPHDAEDRVKLDRALVLKTLVESKKRYTAVLKEYPNDVHALIEMGKIALIARKYSQAQTLFERAVKYQPDSSDATYHLAQAFLRGGNMEAGRAALERTLQLDDRYLKALHDLGWADYLSNDWARAEARFQAALEINPYDGRVLEKMGIVQSKLGRTEQAKDYFKRALEVLPDDAGIAERLRIANEQP